ncbi:MAG: hypothetical protein R3A46_20880 [Thermomicrobiales bacterium]
MTAGIRVGRERGDSLLGAVRPGISAGALNVTRHGLGTGDREPIELPCKHVQLRPIDGDLKARRGR